MSASMLLLIVLALAAIGFILGRVRALSSAGGDSRHLHSLPSYYGWNVALWTMVPALLVLLIWLVAQPLLIERSVTQLIPEDSYAGPGELSLIMSDVRRVAEGLDLAVAARQMSADEAAALSDPEGLRGTLGALGVALGSEIEPTTLAAAQRYRVLNATGTMVRNILVIALALAGFALAWMRTNADFRARNTVEKGVLLLLIGAASVAILTTVGIILSLIFNTVEFFRLYPARDFFFGTTWSPSFGGGSGARSTYRSSRWRWRCRSGFSPRSTCRNTQAPGSAAR
jgi:phosphate transport system permease protein